MHAGNIGIAALSATLAAAIGSALVVYSNRVPNFGVRDEDIIARQASHTVPTPRLGGVGIFVACGVMLAIAPSALVGRYALFLFALAPVFIVGLIEDLGRPVMPIVRLLVAVLASQFIVTMLGVYVNHDEALGLTAYLVRPEFGIPLTLLLMAGMTNAINMIDGMNGLAGIAALIGAIGLGEIADLAGYHELERMCWLLAGAVAGFLLLNFPRARLFLGDSGSYTVGFVLGWFGVSLIFRSGTVSIWAVGLVLFWPIADILWTILRRLGSRRPAMSADRLHFHQLVRRSLITASASEFVRRHANPLTTIILVPPMLTTTLLGVWLWDGPQEALFTFCSALLIYVLAYKALLFIAPRLRRRRTAAALAAPIRPKPAPRQT